MSPCQLVPSWPAATHPLAASLRLLLLPGVPVAAAVLANTVRAHLALLDLLEEVVGIRHAQAIQGGGDVLLAAFLDHAGIRQPFGEGVVEIRGREFEFLARMAQPKLGPERHRAIALFAVNPVDFLDGFLNQLRILRIFRHLQDSQGGKPKSGFPTTTNRQ
jgi:hypothetical protein